ncbi:MAG: hypothetical protein D8M57_18220 [Candidatus Scalindua sp. AMX11]|nr:MAG: hypothetical protein DWQ00_08150 [Candidatus Scalindua sp.]NOG83313.1 DUF799 family lipoprotein [Planctomycetota bacterium]RZV76787.1 MAG: hypothetical protein EX341_12190 [Candidatus Scalindua sp. SCAELEC01]TDE63459.1 MAG: hypothetical protein D8M57_18220 [Candidatus Scalindua sp. AMX11]GJQ57471.1 MAG: hypothetical protein SCALA701_02720 [Candidatus Scalindua sp.]
MSLRKILSGFMVVLVFTLMITGCSSNNRRRTTGDDQFFLDEEGVADHGKKKAIDRIYQIDPGDKEFEVFDTFYKNPPKRVAILPFDNLVGGNYILNEVPIPRFNKDEESDWNWTYANRVRRFFFGHFSAREFQDIELMYVDKVLNALNIKTPNDLNAMTPQELGRILDADALIYGEITDFKNSYYTLYAQIRIGLQIKCVSTEDGSIFFRGKHLRYDNDIRVATNPLDYLIASFQNYMSLRDVYAARASEEVARELVLRIPIVESFIEAEDLRVKEMMKTKMTSLPVTPQAEVEQNTEPDPDSGSLTTLKTVSESNE